MMPSDRTCDGPAPASSTLAAELLQAYRETDYTVYAHPAFVLRVDQPCPGLADYCARQGIQGGCVITAWNPFSEPLGASENQARQALLEQQLQQAGWHWVRAVAAHPHNGWPPEVGCFIEGMPIDTASDWGRRHAQNAILWCGPDTVARLQLLR